MLYCILELMPWLEAAWAGRVLKKSEVLECLGGTLSLVDSDSEWSWMDAPKRMRWEAELKTLVHADPSYDYPDEIVLVSTPRGEALMHQINALKLPNVKGKVTSA